MNYPEIEPYFHWTHGGVLYVYCTYIQRTALTTVVSASGICYNSVTVVMYVHCPWINVFDEIENTLDAVDVS